MAGMNYRFKSWLLKLLPMTQTQIQITTLPHHDGLPMPSYATKGSAGMDLPAAAGYVLHPGQCALIPTGLAIALPDGYEAQIRPRSGLAAKHGVSAHLGTIDADYRGELMVLLFNHGETAFTINRGDRIAQLVVARVEQPEWVFVESLDDSERGAGGFGSSGIA